jgi:phosphoserine phosphatase RsbU/P
MAEAPVTFRYEALHRVLEVARVLGASADLAQVLQVIIDAVRDTLEAERATVFLYDPVTQELYTSVAHGLDDHPPAGAATAAREQEPRGIRIPISQGIAGEAARSQRIINVPDAYADARFNRDVDKRTGFRTRSILSIPLIAFDGELVGVAQVLNKRSRAFDEADEEIATALAAQAAVAIKRARLIQDRLKRQKLERDLQLARQIQQQTIPTGAPVVRGFDLAALNEPAEETGGDAYDIIGACGVGEQTRVIEAGMPADRAVLMIADATGHGIGPALMATGVRAMLRMAVRVGASLELLIRQLNRQVCQDVPAGRFVTCWVGMIDTTDGTLTCFSSGQAPLLYYHASDGRVDILEADEMPFGIDEFVAAIRPRQFHMQPGDVFLVISDGFYESIGPGNRQWGVERATEVIRAVHRQSAGEITAAMRAAVGAFTRDEPAVDDRTIIVIKRL